jgi:hypothetical protein
MSTIVTCSCGARVRVQEYADDRTFCCPRCKAELVRPVAARTVSAQRPTAAGSEALCPICQSPLGETEPVKTCPECEQVHHQECWREVGGCSTYGCTRAPSPEKEAPTTRPLTAWGDTKKYPACGEKIKSIALRCRYCQTDFDTVDPLSVKDLRRGARKADALRVTRITVIVLFAFSLIGCLAPLMLLLCLPYVIVKRQMIAKAGPAFQVLSFASLGLSALYSILMLFFALKP